MKKEQGGKWMEPWTILKGLDVLGGLVEDARAVQGLLGI